MRNTLNRSTLLSLARVSAGLLPLACALATGCGGTDTPADSGMEADAGVADMGFLPQVDAGFPDAESRPDAGPRDSGHYCVEGDQITVGTKHVMIGSTSTVPTNPQGTRSSMTCIATRPNLSIGAPVRLRGCVSFIGTRPSQAELDELEIAVFPAQLNAQPVDPTYNPATGADRTPAARIRPSVSKSFAQNCEHGVEVEIGRDTTGVNGLVTDIPYTIRVRSSSVAGNTWLDSYHFNVAARSDFLEQGSSSIDRCTPQTCSARLNMILVKKAAFADLAARAGVPNLGSLDDHSGPGHVLIQANDCQDIPMRRAIGGFSPVPAETRYLTGALGLPMPAATETSTSGVILGLGFAGTSSAAALSVAGAVALSRDLACTEQFGAALIPVYPDALSFMRSGRETTIP